MESIDFSEEDFDFVKDRIFELAGINLSLSKISLVKSRLDSLYRKSDIHSFDELKKGILNNDLKVIQNFVNILTTNKTEFFREIGHFEFLIQKLIPYWEKAKRDEVKIWCSASSTGEEPYSIAMVLETSLPKNMSYKILATDVDTNVLATAKNGVYPISKKEEVLEEYRQFCTEGKNSADGWFKISDTIHSNITFKQHNLIENSYPGDEVFDLIFCRNVMIYFEKETISTLVQKLYRSLKPDGYLFIGHSETIQGNQEYFNTIQPATFSKVNR